METDTVTWVFLSNTFKVLVTSNVWLPVNMVKVSQDLHRMLKKLATSKALMEDHALSL